MNKDSASLVTRQAILAKKRFEEEQEREKEEQKKKILEMYGAEQFQKPVDARLRLGQTEAYVRAFLPRRLHAPKGRHDGFTAAHP
jgi:hypothetical protein